MKIRTITCFQNPSWPLDEARVQSCGEFLQRARHALAASGYEVQTTRLSTIPFPTLLPDLDPSKVVKLAENLERWAGNYGIEYVSIGPASPDQMAAYEALHPVIAATKNVFAAGLMTLPGGGVSLSAIRACAEVIYQIARISPDGFANLRFAALANIPPGAPFFPAGYSGSQSPSFALGLEAADLAVEAISSSSSLEEARKRLIIDLEHHAANLMETCTALESSLDFTFTGLDFTLAPFPQKLCSIGSALERLGVPVVGSHGSLAAVAFLTDTLDRAKFRRTGFNGLFFPVLEDLTLAQRASEGFLGIKDLLLYSAVCGTGLDTVPLAGDVSQEQLTALLLDLAALAQRLDKPLTARLMPIPGKTEGEPTNFDFTFFANSRVMPLDAKPLTGLLHGNETFNLTSRK